MVHDFIDELMWERSPYPSHRGGRVRTEPKTGDTGGGRENLEDAIREVV